MSKRARASTKFTVVSVCGRCQTPVAQGGEVNWAVQLGRCSHCTRRRDAVAIVSDGKAAKLRRELGLPLPPSSANSRRRAIGAFLRDVLCHEDAMDGEALTASSGQPSAGTAYDALDDCVRLVRFGGGSQLLLESFAWVSACGGCKRLRLSRGLAGFATEGVRCECGRLGDTLVLATQELAAVIPAATKTDQIRAARLARMWEELFGPGTLWTDDG